MDPDYYRVLGVDPSADAVAIRKAFRLKVFECHPDHGGSHEQMVLVNEAWEVLSNPAMRRRYDAARANTTSDAAQRAAAADAQSARGRAEQYPLRWADVENWLNSIAADFAGAKYGSTEMKGFGIHFPEIDNSVSGCLFIGIGMALAWFFVGTTLLEFCESQQFHFRVKAFLIIGLLVAGAWAGAGIHQWIGGALKSIADQRAANEQPQEVWQSQASYPSSADSRPRVLACENCGQKLRVPATKSELLVTCRSCGHKFSCVPGGSD